MTISELLKAVRADNLTLQQVEGYRDDIIHLRTDLKRKESQLLRAKAIFLLESKEKSAAAKKIAWDGSTEGLELIRVRGDLGGLSAEIDALTSRVYSLIR